MSPNTCIWLSRPPERLRPVEEDLTPSQHLILGSVLHCCLSFIADKLQRPVQGESHAPSTEASQEAFLFAWLNAAKHVCGWVWSDVNASSDAGRLN